MTLLGLFSAGLWIIPTVLAIAAIVFFVIAQKKSSTGVNLLSIGEFWFSIVCALVCIYSIVDVYGNR